jgi:hypothetical protein
LKLSAAEAPSGRAGASPASDSSKLRIDLDIVSKFLFCDARRLTILLIEDRVIV